jgi:glycosyltransferase involved in cell wall biosynthesis
VALAPSVKEGWGLCVVEAASHGVPTVAYREAGGLSESIIDGSTGVLVHDLDEMAEQASRLLRDAAARETMGGRAREYAEQFTWHSTAEYWEQLLEHVSRRNAPIAMTDARSQRVRG